MLACAHAVAAAAAVNLLAHALLAAPDADLMFGGLIADFVQGRIDPALPLGVRDGIALHRSIDVFTDAHAQVAAARALFDAPYRRYAGILLDVWFDHLLARDWARLGRGDLGAFSERILALLQDRHDEVPPAMHRFVRYLAANGLPRRYREVEMIGQVLKGLSLRLSRANPIGSALPLLEARAEAIARHFEAFLPDLQAHAEAERVRLAQ